MEKRKLGRTELEISLTGFGAWAIGGKAYGKVNFDDGVKIVQSYLDGGGNHIDTAQGYGDSEKIIGQAIKPYDRHSIIIASKTINDGKAEHIHKVREALNQTLKDLDCSYVDIYYLHSPPESPEDMDRLLKEYEALKEEGLIKYIGASIKGVNVTDATVDLCRQYINDGRIDVIELVYSIFRQKNEAVFQLAKEKNIGVVGRTALESGFLTGKYNNSYQFSDADHRSRWKKDQLNQIFEEVSHLNDYLGQTPYNKLSELALKFVMDNDSIASVIIGARTNEQMIANLKVEDLASLNKEQKAHLIEGYKGFTEMCNTI